MLTLSAASGALTSTLHLGVTPAAGAGRQVCDPAQTSYAVVYTAAPGDEYGVAGASVNYTILGAADGSSVPAGGTLTQFIPTVVDPVFPAGGGVSPLDSTTDGTFSLGVRCQDDSSDHIFQNYWSTIRVKNGTWTFSSTDPTTSPSPSTSTPVTSGTTATPTVTPGTTAGSSTSTSTPTGRQQSGTLTVSPAAGALSSGTHTLTAVPAAGAGKQNCGTVQSFAVLYFSPVGAEYDGEGTQGITLRDRPLQAAGLDVPIGGSLTTFLAAVGAVDFSQSLGADSWLQPLSPGRYSLGVRCQSGTASDPTIYQNYYSTVVVAADGTFSAQGAPSTSTTAPTGTTTAVGRTLTIALLDAAGSPLPAPVSVTQGERLFVSAAGLSGSEKATLVLEPEATLLATATAVDGEIATSIVIPPTVLAGWHTLSVTGATGSRGSLAFQVRRAARTTSPSSTPVARTTGTTAARTTTASSSTVRPSSRTTSSSTSAPPSTRIEPISDPPSTDPPVQPSPAPAADRASDGLAYTGFPATDSMDLGVVLMCSGAVVLSLASGTRTRRRPGVRG